MFEGTFVLGEYPMMGIEWLVGQIGDLIRNNMSEGPLKDMLVDGIVGGVGGVIVFLPNILIPGFSGIVKKGDVSFHVLRGHCIKVLNALRRKPAVVFAQVRVICAHRGFRKSSFHVDVREELINQAFDIRHRGSPFASSSFVVSVPSRSRTERVARMEDSKDVRSKWKPSLDGNQHSGKSIQSIRYGERDTQEPPSVCRIGGSEVHR